MTTLDERDDENAWYELMEAQASNNDFKLDEDQVEHSLPHITLQSATNDDYFEKVHEYNCDHVQSGFASESDTVWQTLLRSVVNCKSVAKVGGMYRLSRSDESAAGHLQRWVAGYLPKSCKILMEIDMFLCSCDDSKMLFTDDLFNPSLVCFMKNAEIRLEVTIYSPHAHHEIPLLSALSCIECMQRETGLLDLVLAGLDGALYECGILKAAPPKWTPLWVEECGHYTHETVLLEQQRPDNSIDTPLLGTGYELCNLR